MYTHPTLAIHILIAKHIHRHRHLSVILEENGTINHHHMPFKPPMLDIHIPKVNYIHYMHKFRCFSVIPSELIIPGRQLSFSEGQLKYILYFSESIAWPLRCPSPDLCPPKGETILPRAMSKASPNSFKIAVYSWVTLHFRGDSSLAKNVMF